MLSWETLYLNLFKFEIYDLPKQLVKLSYTHFKLAMATVTNICLPILSSILGIVSTQYEASTRPRNTAVLSRESSYLDCSFVQVGGQSEQVEWLFFGPDDLSGHRISFNDQIFVSDFTERQGGTLKYNIHLSEDGVVTSYQLQVNHTDQGDAYRYMCRAIQNDISNGAYLLLLGMNTTQ